jgi:hypothetical protein
LTQRQAFEQAANRWSQIITADLPDIFLPGIGLVDDVLIDVSIEFLDGVGGVLGQAGPFVDSSRPQSGLPSLGVMEFDSADLPQLEAQGTLDEIILHEMAHVLGFGTLWGRNGFDLLVGLFFPRFTGEQAAAAYRDLFGLGFFLGQTVPVEALGGPGTSRLHWRETVFTDELMTGFFNPGSARISTATIASLADLGYAVDLSQADPFVAGRSVNGKILGRCGTREAPLLRRIDETTHSAISPIPVTGKPVLP